MEVNDQNVQRMERRSFLALSAGLLGAIVFGSIPDPGRAGETQFPEGRCGGDKNMGKRVLVAYTSKYGSTGGVADAIGKELCGKGLAADVALIRNVGDLGLYQGVVVGSAIYMGKWMPEATDFVKNNRNLLCQLPVAYFLVCMTLSQSTEEKRAEVLSYMDPILETAPEVKPVGIGTFAGALDYNNLSWLNKKILKAKGSPEGDFRDWNAIRAWAREPVSSELVRYESKK
ncbi:MAG: flavodoxin domain-containing protein [Proteobacteria bacterium]|nr:flavodoxin domain-containing protein [Pseudomonadota bacterium]